MKLVSYLQNGDVKLGAIVQEQLYCLQEVNEALPTEVIAFLKLGDQVILETEKQLENMVASDNAIAPVKDYTLLAPVLLPVETVMLFVNM